MPVRLLSRQSGLRCVCAAYPASQISGFTHWGFPMKKQLLFAALAAFPILSVAADATPTDPSPPAAGVATVPQVSQDSINRLRQAFLAQIAVYDAAERAMRSPTPTEAAALSPPQAKSTPTIVNVGSRGKAVQGASTTSLAIATRGPDGKVRVGHQEVDSRTPTKEADHAQ